MDENFKFACAINCMDGRVQDPVKDYIKSNYDADYVDMVTEPGPNKILADDVESGVVNNILDRVNISIKHHGSKLLAVVGHFGCAGNQADKATQINHLKKAKENLATRFKDIEIILLWVPKGWDKAELIK